MSFQERLRNARKNCGLTQQQVAQKLGVTPSTYCGYETGKREPDVEKVKLLASILHISADALLDTNYASSQEDIEIPYHTSHLTPEEARVLAAYRAAEATYRKVALELLETHPAATPARQTLA